MIENTQTYPLLTLWHDSCSQDKWVWCPHIQSIITLVQGETGRAFLVATKPTYEELEQKVKELEEAVSYTHLTLPTN